MHVVIAGGGVAGLEAVLALSELAEGRVDVELVSPSDEFVYRPMLVAEAFGNAEVIRIGLDRVVEGAGARRTKDSLASVDPGRRTVTTGAGKVLEYDALLIALGAQPVEVVPGALTFSGEAERQRFAKLLSQLGRRGAKRIAFVVPRAASWSIAAYELALLTAAERDARRLQGVELGLVTDEKAPLDIFGPAASQLVAARLHDAGVELHVSSPAERFEDGELRISGADPLDMDAVVALPGLSVPPLPGLPQRDNGFLQTDAAMHVAGLKAVWAAGDATWFPIKQGGLAAQQADTAARAIAARAGAHIPIEPFQPMLRGALITGMTPDFLRTPRSDRSVGIVSSGRGLWFPSAKVAARYLGSYLERVRGQKPLRELADVDPSPDPAADRAAHERAVSLILAAADADSAIGDFEGAIKWLSLVEELNLVIPPEYVARRHEWRRRLDPHTKSDPAAERIDPSFASAAAALSELQRRVGWLREIGGRTEGEMREDLSALDEGIDHLIAISRRSGVLESPSASGRGSGR